MESEICRKRVQLLIDQSMFDRIQKIGAIVGSNNIIINGDVVANDEILTTVARQVLRHDFELLSLEAREEMNACVNECTQRVLEQVAEKRLEEKLTEFVHPSTQWALYATLKGYTQSETQEQREMMVDSMIDLIQENWNSTERMIIDSALEIIPKLSPVALSTLGILQLRHQLVLAPIGVMIDHYFSSLTPLVEQMAGISTLDVEFLKQEKLVLPLPGQKSTLPFEQYMLTNYDLFFRKPLPEGVYEDYCKIHPEAHEAVTDEPMAACMMWINGNNNETGFCCPNSGLLKRTLADRHQDYIIPHVDALMGMMAPYTEEEVREYFINFTPAWARLIELFSGDVFTRYTLSITGNYIGGKMLAKVSHGKPLPLSNYNIE